MLIMGMNDFWETNLFHKNLIKKVSQDLSGFLIISGAQETWTLQKSHLLPCRTGSCFLHGQTHPASTELAGGDQGAHSTGSLSHLGEKENHTVCQLESHAFRAELDFYLIWFWEFRRCIWLAQKHLNIVSVSQSWKLLCGTLPQTAGKE